MNRSMVKQIVLATDFSECAGKVQDYAAFLTRTYGANLSIIHVPESPLWYGSNAATILYLEQAQKEGERRWRTLRSGCDRRG